ncbi:MAG: PfkB family carbohydrate kinase, partial [Planctomycetota bacterium]
RFDDGNQVLGGAPLNVAWNLHQQGQSSYLVSAIGNDPSGKEILSHLERAGMPTIFIGNVDHAPTGVVNVTYESNTSEVSYDIVDRQAYDFIPFGELLPSIKVVSPKVIYHGTLCFRNSHNRTGLKDLLSRVDVTRFVDVNLREQWFDESLTIELIADATWIKLSHQELEILSGATIQLADSNSLVQATHSLFSKLNSERRPSLIVTCGERDSFWLQTDHGTNELSIFSSRPQPISNVVDPVGAGDAFAATCVYGILNDRPPQEILDNANRFAALVCSIRGATTTDLSHYNQFQWHGESAEPSTPRSEITSM